MMLVSDDDLLMVTCGSYPIGSEYTLKLIYATFNTNADSKFTDLKLMQVRTNDDPFYCMHLRNDGDQVYFLAQSDGKIFYNTEAFEPGNGSNGKSIAGIR